DDVALGRVLARAPRGQPAPRRPPRLAAPDPAVRAPSAGAASRHACRLGRVRARGEAPLMCGLCGVVAYDRPAEREAVNRMLDGLAHRGPDGRGVFADDDVCLGHLRLAIIDLSDAGLEPFASDDGRLQLIFNG